MNLLVTRGAPIGAALPGEMTCDGVRACYTLERAGVQIPEGTYQVVLYNSPHFGREMPLLLNVPGRTFIELHTGNVPGASDGCIIVGQVQDPSTGELFNSTPAFLALFQAIEGAVEHEGCTITVQQGTAS